MKASSSEVLDAIRRFERESVERLEATRAECAELVAAARDAAEETIVHARRRAGEQTASDQVSVIAAAEEEATRIEAGISALVEQLRTHARAGRDRAVTAMVAVVAPEG